MWVKRILTAAMVAVATMATAPVAWAEDLAVIITNESYRDLPRPRDARGIANLERDFRNAGFRVVRFANTRSGFATNEGDALWRRVNRSERLVVVISGHMAMANGQGWLLHTDWAGANGFSIGNSALPLAPFFEAAARRQGDAVIAVGEQTGVRSFGAGIRSGFQKSTMPQGVTLIHGPNGHVRNFIAGELLNPSQSLSDAAKATPEALRVIGFLPRSRGFLEAPRAHQPDPVAVEQAFWTQMRAQDTAQAYQTYLNRYPNGQFAGQARQRVAQLTMTPAERALEVEKSLNLNRDQRRVIQRNLTLLGYDTRGVDGVFGGNTRKAIRAWQSSIGVLNTGYLNANQITRIDAAATVRANQLRIQAEERRRAEERRDRRYWNDTGAGTSEDGLRAYLQRYPDGVHSQHARARLNDIEREQRRQAQQAERVAWDNAVMQGNLDSYQAYLNVYPNGRFAAEARARVHSLSNPETLPDVIDSARAEEKKLNLNKVTRHLIEGSLRHMGLEPGRVDGKFTPETRRALRNFQRANELDVTGFVTKQTLVLVMARAIDN